MGRLRFAKLLAISASLASSCSPRLDEADFKRERELMTARLERNGITDLGVLGAIRKVPRHKFVPGKLQVLAYDESALSIGYDQTLSAPHMIGQILQLANPRPYEKVLEIRTGCGYPTALLAELSKNVHTIEIVRPIAESAQKCLQGLGYSDIQYHIGSGLEGWPEQGPYDLIIAWAAADHVPPALTEQLADGGRMVIPIGDLAQALYLVKKKNGKISQEEIGAVKFVPMLREQDLTKAQRGER